jgi:acyl-coenzyme A thioesterase PaaI-like protein
VAPNLPADRKNNSFVSGQPDGQVLRVRYYDDTVAGQRVGKVWFGPHAEGPPGCAHGGSLAAVLDEAMGNNCWVRGHRVVAGTLTIRYLKSVPLGTTAIVRTGIDHVEGRKVHAIGWIEGLDGVRYTDASAIYIRLTPEQEAAFVAAAAERDYTMPDAY